MNQRDYIYLIYKNSLQIKMEQEFEKANPLTKVTFRVMPSQREMRIAIFDRDFNFVKSYMATDFDCVPETPSMMEFVFEKHPKSKSHSDDKYVKQFFLRLMKNHFESYKEDYKAHINLLADEDLGEQTELTK